MIRSLEVPLGIFHDVTAVAVSNDCISILDTRGEEKLIPIKPCFNPKPQPVEVRGEFGDFARTRGGAVLRGIEPRDVTAIEIEPELTDGDLDFHVRRLRLRSASGLTLSWELFCEGPGE